MGLDTSQWFISYKEKCISLELEPVLDYTADIVLRSCQTVNSPFEVNMMGCMTGLSEK